VAVLAVIRSRWAGCEHCRLPSGTRVGCRRLGRPLRAPAGAAPRTPEQSRRRRRPDDHGIRAPRAVAEQECCARSTGRRRGRRPAAPITVAPTDESESWCQGTAVGSEEAAHRRQATASSTSGLTTRRRGGSIPCPRCVRRSAGRTIGGGTGCGARRPCCTRTSTRSTPRSSSVTRPSCAAGRSSSAAVSCWRRATRRRPVGCAPRWGGARPATCARMPWSSRHGWTRTRRPVEPCSRSSAIRRRSWKAFPSTRRSSKSGVSDASPARPSRSRCDCVRGFVRRSGWPSRSGSRGRSSSRRSPARSASPTGCCWSSPSGSRRSCSRCRSNGCGGSAP
jgi:hypothetical protein